MKDNRSFKEKFLHNSFFNYFRAFNACPFDRNKIAFGETFAIIPSGLLVLFLTVLFEVAIKEDFQIPQIYLWITIFTYYICLLYGTFRRRKPSLHSTAPINYKKRIAYSFLINLLTVVAVILFIAVFILIIICIGSLIEGVWVLSQPDEEVPNVFLSNPNAVDILFHVFMYIMLFSAATGISYIKSKGWRIGSMFIFPVLLFVLIICMFPAQLYVNADKICLTVFAVITVAVFVLSVFFAVKYEKPKKF